MKKRRGNKKLFYLIFVIIILLIICFASLISVSNENFESKNIFQKTWDNIKSSYVSITGKIAGVTGKVVSSGLPATCNMGDTYCSIDGQGYYCAYKNKWEYYGLCKGKPGVCTPICNGQACNTPSNCHGITCLPGMGCTSSSQGICLYNDGSGNEHYYCNKVINKINCVCPAYRKFSCELLNPKDLNSGVCTKPCIPDCTGKICGEDCGCGVISMTCKPPAVTKNSCFDATKKGACTKIATEPGLTNKYEWKCVYIQDSKKKCKNPLRPKCNERTGECECTSNNFLYLNLYCNDPLKPKCDSNSKECVECKDDSDCANFLNGEKCDPTLKKCVECVDNNQCADKFTLKVCDKRQTIKKSGKNVANPNYEKCALQCNAVISENNGIVCPGKDVCDLRETIKDKSKKDIANPGYGQCNLECVSNSLEPIQSSLNCIGKSGFMVCDDNFNSLTYGKCMFDCNGNDIDKDIICNNLDTYCDVKEKKCVECTSDKDCKNPFQPACDTNKKSKTLGKCIECTDNKYCNVLKGKAICSKSINKCVACLENSDCKIYKSSNGVSYNYCISGIGDLLTYSCKGQDCFKFPRSPNGGVCSQCLNENGDKEDKDCKKINYKYCNFGSCVSMAWSCPFKNNPENTKYCYGTGLYFNCCKPNDMCGVDKKGYAICVNVPKCKLNEKICSSSDNAICCPRTYDCIVNKEKLVCTTTCINKDGNKGIQCGEECCWDGTVCRYYLESKKYICEEENFPGTAKIPDESFYCGPKGNGEISIFCKKGETCAIFNNDVGCCPEGSQPVVSNDKGLCIPIGTKICKDNTIIDIKGTCCDNGFACRPGEKCISKKGVSVGCKKNNKIYEPIKPEDILIA